MMEIFEMMTMMEMMVAWIEDVEVDVDVMDGGLTNLRGHYPCLASHMTSHTLRSPM